MVRPRRLICALLVALLLAGCASKPAVDPSDPEIFRPKKPVYPLPE
jgi:type IV pilus biogenesis protein CpaD/CtpE